MMWNGWYWGWGMFWMWIFWLIILIAFIWILWRGAAASRRRPGWFDPAEQELRIRYARGEIDKDEYERRLSDLRRPR